jgi:hypothetical protein
MKNTSHKSVEQINSTFYINNSFRKVVPFVSLYEKIWQNQTDHACHYNAAYVICMLYN